MTRLLSILGLCCLAVVSKAECQTRIFGTGPSCGDTKCPNGWTEIGRGRNLRNNIFDACILGQQVNCKICPEVSSPIKHFIVLMLENRSFDHYLGFLKKLIPGLDGLNGDEYQYINVSDPSAGKIRVSPDALDSDPDPSHSVTSTTIQVYGEPGYASAPYPPTKMDGFVQDAILHGIPKATPVTMFNPETAPILNTLAQEYAVFDKWHASVPGPTEVNRMYFHSGTSHGASTNDEKRMFEGYPQKSFYKQLLDGGRSFRIYASEVSTALLLSDMRKSDTIDKFRFMPSFYVDAALGQLPEYSVLEPAYFTIGKSWKATDQHPAHSVYEGEKFIKRVYEALRASPQWEESALIITYDEHGGFYDHVPTPVDGVPSPDGIDGQPPGPPFDFKRLGVRVPTIMISPWINKGTVVHEGKAPTPTSQFDHTSHSSTLKKIFGLDSFLSKRAEWASTYEDVFTQRTTPRTDCLSKLPDAVKSLESFDESPSKPVSDLQQDHVRLVSSLFNDGEKNFSSEGEAGMYVFGRFWEYVATHSSIGSFLRTHISNAGKFMEHIPTRVSAALTEMYQRVESL